MRQIVNPQRRIFTAGEVVEFILESEELTGVSGRAMVRCNLGRAAVRREELIEESRSGVAAPGMDWHDVEMQRESGGRFSLRLPLCETGVFEAKCCFIPADGSAIRWPGGDNFRLKVISSGCAAGNGIYCAFVRQHGRGCTLAGSAPLPSGIKDLDQAGYTVIPPSGTFRDLIGHLDHIFGILGCGILQLLPIHPVPTQYGRMGRFGSPFASIDYFNVDPALADFDPRRTPMEQFEELVDAVHLRSGRIFMDIPVNHTGWASKLQIEHPDYFIRRPDGRFENPGAWGVGWEDLCRLDYHDPHVRELMAKVFLFWCTRGVDGFRCDAGYMLPVEAWEHIVSRVRREYPDTVFLLEGLGGPADRQERLLGETGLDWAYSELFQCYSRDEIERYYPYACRVSAECGTLANFAETHDNLRLAAQGKIYAANRFAVAALLSSGGVFGFANGAEFFAAERIDVHGNGALNYGAVPNLNAEISRYNRLLSDHSAFDLSASIAMIQQGEGNVLAVKRTGYDGRTLLVLINLNCSREETVGWNRKETPDCGFDLLSDTVCRFTVSGDELRFRLPPGRACCIAFDDYRIPDVLPPEPPRQSERRLAAAAMRLASSYLSPGAAAGVDPGLLRTDPRRFISEISGIVPPPLTRWTVPSDARREVMIPPRDSLLIESDTPFRFEVTEGKRTIVSESALAGGSRSFFILLPPFAPEMHDGRRVEVHLTIFDPQHNCSRHVKSKLLLLPEAGSAEFSLPAAHGRGLYAFGSNSTGGYAFVPAAWGEMHSKYNALLAANLNPDHPVDRTVIFSRCRAWLVVNDFSQELTPDSVIEFSCCPDNTAHWIFRLPSGQGSRATLRVDMAFATDANAVRLCFSRPVADERPGELDASTCAKLILRPDLEWRINHELTKAYAGAETAFPVAVHPDPHGFRFSPGSATAEFSAPGGSFHLQPEWLYMVDLPFERRYGLGDKTDLFSPGYFEFHLRGGDRATLTVEAGTGKASFPRVSRAKLQKPEDFIGSSLRHYIARRGERRTVIAGYPWFLDWGRDTLIALRGLVHGEFHRDCAEIIHQFASFEDRGTIPNMIHGDDTGNRDTSDAPLYLIIAARDYIGATGNSGLLNTRCGSRTLREVLESIADHYLSGTPNGIAADPDSLLVYSPPHFTWMDTNHPAGTPREGYPIEIQALWFAALRFLGRNKEAEQVAASINRFFFSEAWGFCSDCLHATRGVPAADAVPDDHLRPNQLLAITLGAISDACRCSSIIDACGELLVPGAIRTLADRPVEFKLPVESGGRLLNDPSHPYRGRYEGPEDSSRKVAYHNGTAWCWPFPAYCEALFLTGGDKVRRRAMSLLESMSVYFCSGVPFQLPEVADGDAPHRPGGCSAQAWSVSEFFRVYEILKRDVEV